MNRTSKTLLLLVALGVYVFFLSPKAPAQDGVEAAANLPRPLSDTELPLAPDKARRVVFFGGDHDGGFLTIQGNIFVRQRIG